MPGRTRVSRETPAVTAVVRKLPGGGAQEIYACADHVAATIRQLGGQNLDLRPADPSIHGCKGCWDDWPA